MNAFTLAEQPGATVSYRREGQFWPSQGPVFPTVEVVSGGEGFGAFNTYSLSWDYQGPAIFFNFGTSGPHTSLDRLTIGTFGEAIPAPGALALLGLAGLGRRRRS